MDESGQLRIDDFYLSDAFGRAIRYWWLVGLMIITGGIAGYLISMTVKPVYESTSVITTVIDFAYAGRLTDYEEDYLLSAVGDIIQSDDVMKRVIEEGISSGLAINAAELKKGFTASRQGYRWELSSRFNDPAVAQQANRLWIDHAMQALEAFRLNSIKALATLNAQVGIESCFQQAVILDPVSPYCSVEDMQNLQQQLGVDSGENGTQHLLSRLLASRISFAATREPDLPATPVHLGRNLSTLAGALIGLLLAIVLFITGFPRLKREGSKT